MARSPNTGCVKDPALSQVRPPLMKAVLPIRSQCPDEQCAWKQLHMLSGGLPREVINIYIYIYVSLSTQLSSARFGSARLGSARLSSARLGSARLGSARLSSAQLKSSQVKSSQVKSSQLNKTQLNKTQFNCTNRVYWPVNTGSSAAGDVAAANWLHSSANKTHTKTRLSVLEKLQIHSLGTLRAIKVSIYNSRSIQLDVK